jgi:protease-4
MILTLIPWEDTLNIRPKVGIVDINEPITDSREIIKNINYFYKESSISAIVVRIETPGGGVAASQEIYEKVRKISENNSKPIIASMGGVAASGGYYIALGADTIIANPGTATGSIGVIMSYPVIEKMLDKIGID